MSHVFTLLTFVKPYWRRSSGALALLTALVLMDLSIPRLIQRIIDLGIRQQDQSVVIHTSLLMLGISVVSALFAVGNNILSVQVGESVARDLRDALFVKIGTLSFGNLDKLKTGELMVRLTSDVSAFQRLTQVSLRIGTRAPLLMIGSLILMVNTSTRLALTILPLLLLTSGVIILFISKMEPLFRSVQQKLDRLNTVLQENIAGVRLVKAFARADFEGARFETANEGYAQDSIRVMKVMSTMSPALIALVNAGIVIVIWAGGVQAIGGRLSVGQIVAFTNYLLTTMMPLILMAMMSTMWAGGIASARRLNQVLETVPEVQDNAAAPALPHTIEGRIVFENVTFSYGGDRVLDTINLVAEPGEMVAILGATGAGKSTLIQLIPRFYNCTAGKVLIDGIDISLVQQDSLLAQIGFVPQETVLFSGSVRDNIRYGRSEASDADIVEVAQAAQAHDFIMELPRGYDTHVEQRGVNLSGGQKQRIAIARALLTNPRIMLLDDCTSSVDVETEARIQQALAQNSHRPTILIVAQRISTVLKADRIVVIDRGRIVATGTHRELMRSSAIYQEIYESQLGNGADAGGTAGNSARSQKR